MLTRSILPVALCFVLIFAACEEDLVQPNADRDTTLRVWVVKFYCEDADDEGVNDIEIIEFHARVSAYNRKAGSPDSVPIVENRTVFAIEDQGWIMMVDNDQFVCPMSFVDITFDTRAYDFELASIVVYADALETDEGWSDDEFGSNTIEIFGQDFFKNEGWHYLYVTSADFRFRVEIFIEEKG